MACNDLLEDISTAAERFLNLRQAAQHGGLTDDPAIRYLHYESFSIA
jgi:hypothetical protein